VTAVSILMPAYNYARYLPEAIDSVLAQSDPNWELLVMDDNSSDNTWEVLTSYRDPRIHVFRSDVNRGAAATSNGLYRRATGDLIAHLDADDRYHREFIARHRAFLSEHPDVDICGTYTCEIGADGQTNDQSEVTAWFNHDLDLNEPENWVWQNRLSHGSTMIRRSVYDHIGLASEDLSVTLDWDFWVRALSAGHRFHVLPDVLFEWRVHGSNITYAGDAERVRCWSVISGRTFHPYLDRIHRTDLKAQNIAGFLTHKEMANQPTAFVTSILGNVLTGDPDELAEAVAHVATEITGLRDAYVELRESIRERRQESTQLTAELSETRMERNTLSDRLHAAEIDRRSAQAQLQQLQSKRLYRAARRVRRTLSPKGR
jgi:glycosyltransferase involved in cell wall biosynthesis